MEDQKICKGESVLMGVPQVPNAKYEWSASNSLSVTDIAQPIATPSETTTYYLTITDTKSKSSCAVRTDTVVVEVVDDICVPVQTLLTPNDHFYVYDLLPNTSLKLYNAIGQLIYISNNYQNNFDVTLLPSGMYFYELKFNYSNEWIKGKIEKLR